MGYPPPLIAGSSNTSSWSHVIGEMFGGQHRVDEVTRTESRRLDRDKNSKIAAHHSPRNKRGSAAGVCAKEIKTLLTRPTSLEMSRTRVAVEKLAHFDFAKTASRQEALQTIFPSLLDILYHRIFDFF